ncbi:glycosyltransferase family 2 protein [Lutimaribacter saemankumensis]|uniref:Glycosyl transferase family 2 n=1 Tax=Lutimaribacter saemankumensis TaxID=490829 RepID=A0A1G8NBG3_9RHOB|nr:glycosyltransferase [Lutimaribacter saemankumensis]SDI76860.1 Glycosyl transferase family 2 [Lutimaribacter saemankumensis]
MTLTRASVVIVSRGRPETLALCLAGVARLRNAEYEVIVVADSKGIEAAQALPFSTHLKLVRFDRANISEARNLGVAEAAGDVVAFIDDDAVPEPRWLEHLVRPFEDARVAATGGFVRGRNGISFQWKARVVDATGRAYPARVDEERPTVLIPPQGRAVKTEGTNMAVRRDLLAGMGGFDPAYRFFLDETDLNMRLANAGHATAVVPMAEVHHAYAPSVRRTADRAVTDLHEIGASKMVFLRKHCPDQALWPGLIDEMRRAEKRRLLQQMVDGRAEPRDVRITLAGFDAGVEEGRTRPVVPAVPIPAPPRGFQPFPSRATGTVETLAGRIWSRGRLQREAARRAEYGTTVSVYVFSHTALYHSVRFLPNGVWYQRGGLWGRSEREDPVWQWWRFSNRVKRESGRSAHCR